MALILAIESDRRQAAQLSAMARSRLKAELVVADSADGAFAALGARVPDLILTPALLSPRDETAIAEHLRRLDDKAAHVQTLAVPVLAASDQQGYGRSMLSALRRDKSTPAVADGCDPAVFAEQVQAYLERAAMELEARRSSETERQEQQPAASHESSDARPVQHRPETHEEADAHSRRGRHFEANRSRGGHVTLGLSARDEAPARPDVQDWQTGWQVADLDAVAAEMAAPAPAEPAATAEPPAPAESSVTRKAEEAFAEIDLAALLDEPERPVAAAAPAAARKDLDAPRTGGRPEYRASVPAADAAASPEAAIMAAVAAVERLLQPEPPATPAPAPAGPELRLPSLTPDPATVPAARASAKKSSPNAPALPTMRTTAEPPKKRVRRPKPLQDEWGLFDPAQCGFAALVQRLEEITQK